MFWLTVTSRNGNSEAYTQAFQGELIQKIRPTTVNNTATAARFEYLENGELVTYAVSESAATVATNATSDMAEAGAELLANKDASNGYVGLTALKINFKNVLNTFTSFFTNSNTAARTYTFQDRNGTIADDTDLALKAPLASPTFTGNPVVPTQAVGNNSDRAANTAFVEARARQTYYGTATGTDTYAVTLDPILADAGLGFGGIQIRVRFTNASTGPSTLAANGTAAVAIVKKNGSTAIGAGDIAANTWYELFNDGTSWVALGI